MVGHDRVIRVASGSASERSMVGSNLLGSTARPGALMQGEVAAGREVVRATVIYTKPNGPLQTGTPGFSPKWPGRTAARLWGQRRFLCTESS